MTNDTESAAIEQRIERFLLMLGAAMTLGAGIGWGIRATEAAAIGTALCWVNFRWLRQGAAGLMRLGMAQAGRETVHVPRRVHAKFFGRLVLLLIVAYVILAWLRLPAIAFLCGLMAVVPAILLELVYEVKHGQHRWNAS
ncbi:MAG TPA: ATP synthase subunit I [Candidatus Dormibacteraeota bacterium]|nr:ATP synthase subunit I [Candidatus Dormibacteraeota bacterium]